MCLFWKCVSKSVKKNRGLESEAISCAASAEAYRDVPFMKERGSDWGKNIQICTEGLT